MIYDSPRDGSRTAFQLWKVHESRSRTASITAIALQQGARRLYLGFSDGQLEEYRIQAGPTPTGLADAQVGAPAWASAETVYCVWSHAFVLAVVQWRRLAQLH